MAEKPIRFDIQNYIKSQDLQTGYLEAVLEDGDPALIAAAIGDIARARSAVQFAKRFPNADHVRHRGNKPG